MSEKRILTVGTTNEIKLIDWLRKLGLLDRDKIDLPPGVDVTRSSRGVYTVTEAES